MAEGKKSSAMLPIIIIGAAMFGFGIFQSTRPPEPEVNQGFVAPSTPTVPANPRTMQAPDAPVVEKDAAERAASSSAVTTPSATPAQVIDQAWFAPIKAGETQDFSRLALLAFKAQVAQGTLTCSPAMARMREDEVLLLKKVTCLSDDGTKIESEFTDSYKVNNVGPLHTDGEITVTTPDKQVIKVVKSGDEFGVMTETN
jgi:hypothetical protein